MVVNTAEFLPGEFTRNADFSLPTERLKRTIVADAGRDKAHFIDATRIATALFGQSIGANMFLVGYAYQLGAIPLSAAAIERAIELNGEAVAMNKAAFHWGRRAAVDRAAVEALAKPAAAKRATRGISPSRSMRSVERRVKFLTDYQNAAYAARYRGLVEKAKAAEAARAPGKCGLADAVARYLFKLMAYKDEYEVARLYTDGSFASRSQPSSTATICASNFISRRRCWRAATSTTGLPRKMSFGPWLLPAFRLLAKLKFLRGTAFDPFGRSLERRTERKLIADYEAMLDEVLAALTPDNHHLAVGLARHPGKDPRLRPRQAAPSRRRQGRRGGAVRAIPAGPPALLKAAE